MATLHKDQNAYLLSVYGYLHFQYNGWFFFAVMGLITNKIEPLIPSKIVLKRIFWVFAFASVPGYFLSALWLELPNWLYIIVVLSKTNDPEIAAQKIANYSKAVFDYFSSL